MSNRFSFFTSSFYTIFQNFFLFSTEIRQKIDLFCIVGEANAKSRISVLPSTYICMCTCVYVCLWALLCGGQLYSVESQYTCHGVSVWLCVCMCAIGIKYMPLKHKYYGVYSSNSNEKWSACAHTPHRYIICMCVCSGVCSCYEMLPKNLFYIGNKIARVYLKGCCHESPYSLGLWQLMTAMAAREKSLY